MKTGVMPVFIICGGCIDQRRIVGKFPTQKHCFDHGPACTIFVMIPSTTFKPFIYLSLLLAIAALAACAPSPEQIAAQTATAQTAIAANWTPTPTSTATATPTATPTITPSPTPTQEPTLTPTSTPAAANGPRTSFTIKGVTFSLVAPDGWTKSDDPNRAILNGPSLDGVQVVLTFSLDQYTLFGSPMTADDVGIPMFAAHVQDTLAGMTKNVIQLSEDFGSTDEGKSYFRWEVEHNPNGQELHQAFYILGSGEWFLTVMYGRPKSAGAEYDTLVDQAVKTLIFDK